MTTLIGITGGIGTGKSTVSQMLRELGVQVVDADKVGRELMQPGGTVYVKVVAVFGPRILAADKTIDRSALGAIVFNDPVQRKLLNSLTHPAIVSEMQARYRDFEQRGECLVAFEIPLLIESGLQNTVDEVWLVTCSLQTQLERVMARGFTEEQALARIAAQMPLNEKVPYAHRLIHTDEGLEATFEQVKKHWRAICGCLVE